MENLRGKKQTVELKVMLYEGFHRWKLILIVGVIFAVLLGIVGGLSAINVSNDKYANWDSMRKIRDGKKSYTASIEKAQIENETIEKKIADQQEYLDKSIYINLDPYNVQSVEVEYYVSTDYKIIPGMDYQNIDLTDTVANSYITLLTNIDITNEIAEKFGMQRRYLMEILHISVSNRILTIKVIHNDSDIAKQISDSVISYLPSVTQKITDGIASHKLTLLNESKYSFIDLSLLDKKEEQKASLQVLNQTKTENDNIIDDANYNIRELEKEETEIGMKSDVSNRVVKCLIAGLILGVFIAYVYCCLAYVTSDKIYNENDIEDCFGLRIIGELASKKDNISELDVIVSNILGMKEKYSSIFITGSIEETKINEICEKISLKFNNIEIKSAHDIINNPRAVKNLSECEAVLLVEQYKKSKCSVIAKEINKAEWFGKPVIGCVIIE